MLSFVAVLMHNNLHISKKSITFGTPLPFGRVPSESTFALSCKLQSFTQKITLVQAQTNFLCVKSCKFEKFVVTLQRKLFCKCKIRI